MALCTVGDCLLIPGLNNTAAVPTAWLVQLVAAADAACKLFCKQNLELQSLVEYYSGTGTPDIICRQCPVWQGQTLVTSDVGAALPLATINVVSTEGFCPGLIVSNPAVVTPTLSIQTGTSSWSAVTYTGVTATSFTGCSGGTGNIAQAPYNNVSAPVVWYNQQGYSGQMPSGPSTNTGFTDACIQPKGLSWMADVDSDGQRSRRALLKRVGGYGGFGTGAWTGYGGAGYGGYNTKLAGTQLPYWPRGMGNLKVGYSCGYYPIPADLQSACTSLVAFMARTIPNGADLSSESLGAYSYSVLTNTSPDVMAAIGTHIGTLKRYREWSLGT